MRLDDLNAQQRVAVDQLTGPVLVTAGAGSGKTRVLVARFLHAVASSQDPGMVDRIVTITFTEKAAGELADRVRRALRQADRLDDARRVDVAWISTIHGLCARILREHAFEAGLDPEFSVLDDVTAATLRTEAFEQTVTDLLEDDAEIRALFGGYEFDSIARIVLGVGDALRAHDVTAEACLLPEAPTIQAAFAEAERLLREVDELFAAADTDPETVDGWRQDVGARRAELCELQRRGLADTDAAAAALRVLQSKPPKLSAVGLSAVKSLYASARTQAQEPFAQVWTRPVVSAIVKLTGCFLERFEERKRALGGLDFEDLQVLTARLVASSDVVAREYRDRFDLVMVDEFQDTDEIQLRIVEALAGDDLCTVGDSQQSIYGFRGADLQVYQAHISRMREQGATPVTLSANYRSAPEVLSFVNAFFSREELFGTGGLVALSAGRDESACVLPDSVPRVQFVFAADAGPGHRRPRDVEAAEVARRLATLKGAGVAQRSMVILVRTYTHADTYADALAREGLTPTVVGGSRFFRLPEVRVLGALSRAIANPLDDEALGALLFSEAGRLSDDALYALVAAGEDGRHGRLWAGLKTAESLLAGADLRRGLAIRQALERARAEMGGVPLRRTLLSAVEDIDYDLVLLQPDRLANGPANLMKYLRMADDFEASGGHGIAAFAEHVRLKESLGAHEAPAVALAGDEDTVRIMSIHAAKGLEFPVVVVADLGAGGHGDSTGIEVADEDGCLRVEASVPSWATRGSTIHTAAFEQLKTARTAAEREESKRLLYVACTRAQEVLILSGCGSPNATDKLQTSYVTWLRDACGLEHKVDGPASNVAVVKGPLGDAEVQVTVMHLPDEQEIKAEDAVLTEDSTEASEPEGEEVVPWAPEVAGCEDRAPAERAPVAPRHLSYSDLALYEKCHLRFFAEKVLRVRPAAGKHDPALAFGSALHGLMQLSIEGASPDDARIRAVCGYLGVDQSRTAELRRALDATLASPPVLEARALPWCAAEVPFAVRVGTDGGFVLRGAMDLLGRDAEQARIVDYKTGVGGASAEELMRRYRLQAQCYALVVLGEGAEEVTVTFVRPQVIEASGGPQSCVHVFSRDDRASIEAQLLQTYSSMQASDYEARADYERDVCSECPIANVYCDVPKSARKGRGPSTR